MAPSNQKIHRQSTFGQALHLADLASFTNFSNFSKRSLLSSLLFSFSLFSYLLFFPSSFLISFLVSHSLCSRLSSRFSSVNPAARRLSRSKLGSAAPLHSEGRAVTACRTRVLSSSRAQALYSDSESHYYWDAKIKEIARSRKRATLQHFSLLLGPKPSETQGRLGMPKVAVRSTDPPPGTPEIEGTRFRALPRRS